MTGLYFPYSVLQHTSEWKSKESAEAYDSVFLSLLPLESSQQMMFPHAIFTDPIKT